MLKKGFIFILLSSFLLSIAMAGCGKTANEKSEGQAQKDIKYTIGIALASATNPLYVTMNKGITQEAEKLNLKLKTVIANEDQSRQVNGIQDLITSKVNAIIVSPITTEGSIVAYEAAQKAGIPVVSVARSIKRQDLESAYVGMDIVDDGRRIAKWLVDKLGGKGNVAMLKGVAGASFTMDLEKGFKEIMSQYPEIKIVAEYNSAITKEEGLKLAENILTANPKLNAIYAANDELALGAVQAAETAGRLNDILITGYNGVPAAIEAIKAGKLEMTISLRPFGWGQLAVDTVYDILEGKEVPEVVFNQTKIVDIDNVKNINPDEIK